MTEEQISHSSLLENCKLVCCTSHVLPFSILSIPVFEKGSVTWISREIATLRPFLKEGLGFMY